jgi:adenosine kinase
MKIFVSGSLAYDRIMDFPGKFSDHILPDKIHILNVCFTVNGLKEKFGGTAGNIAYSLALLGEQPRILATAGKDFDRYEAWLREDFRRIDCRSLYYYRPGRQSNHRIQSRRHEAPVLV